jgi:hypothetical protein
MGEISEEVLFVKTIRKFLCVAITLIMLVGLFPLSALASGEEALPEEQPEAAEPVEQEQPEVVETPAPADEPEQPETTPPRI